MVVQPLTNNELMSLVYSYHAKIEEMKRELAKLEQEAEKRKLI